MLISAPSFPPNRTLMNNPISRVELCHLAGTGGHGCSLGGTERT